MTYKHYYYYSVYKVDYRERPAPKILDDKYFVSKSCREFNYSSNFCFDIQNSYLQNETFLIECFKYFYPLSFYFNMKKCFVSK